ncbi:GNAT family N-acetyltransferase [Lentzea flaviverrucosa]|uniref:GNAT family N-acetyltransferase n=1 Tax=Lentzea flaviverrucosa TaxID=200379 RepID=UPI001FECE92A|nr:GNAT family N-acetyltransferase [Lentzea flaviverrucosa]
MPVELWKNKVTNQAFRPSASFLLREAGGVAAGLLVTMNWEADTEATGVRDAHFMVIGTLPGHRNRGVASALLGHALRAAVDQGYDRALLSVDSENVTGGVRHLRAGRVHVDDALRAVGAGGLSLRWTAAWSNQPRSAELRHPIEEIYADGSRHCPADVCSVLLVGRERT